MTDIIVHYCNQLKVKLECSPSVMYELHDAFSFFVPGYKFTPQFKSGRWDGRVSMIDARNRQLFRGLLPKLEKWCETSEYSLSYSDPASLAPKLAFDTAYLADCSGIGKYQPKDYQVEAVTQALTNNQHLILSPTGSGKSYIIYLMCRWLLDNTENGILITVPTKALSEQLITDFEDYAEPVGWDVRSNMATLYAGKDKDTDHRIKVSTWQTAVKQPPEWFEQFDAYICDEAHGADSKSIKAIVNNMVDAPVRIGLTGTLDGTKMHELEMQALFGGVSRVATTRELMDRGDLAKIEIDCIRLRYNDDDIKIAQALDYQGEIKFLLNHPKRNLVLTNLALQQSSNTLLLINEIEHGDLLHEMLLKKAAKYGKEILYIKGEVDVTEREIIRKKLETGTNFVLIASIGTFSVGANVKNLHFAIFGHPFKSQIRTLQSIGRTLRVMPGKTHAKLIDVADDLVKTSKRGKETLNTAMSHFIERLSIYQAENFPYKIVKVSL